ncbi:GNAT family N-acetyltransferase [Alkalihalobacillus sp. LMS39]|uniref:GNAT family N-acetyltransferase n=1 Tax=Alkalihalobacillus sp. LMS39 TaxID=2924032 RepID=UPI001FB2DC80|nr:GNAT family N-acetyltransferase [Alkalihalobacillus sp. LMS39]UOE95849.1 GNAT family N-acetyltransferase [Alkalihalobacillus sp. LMS39]
MLEIRPYKPEDETGWVRCRVLSFLDTAYYDNVLPKKEIYQNPAIELVAVLNNEIVGLIDIEYETEPNTVCTKGSNIGGMIWHIAVHPDYRRKRIASHLLHEAEKLAKDIGITYFEAWTRDDKWVHHWYESRQFVQVDSYLHVFLEEPKELKVCNCDIPQFTPILAFAHYTGEDKATIRGQFKRVHDCFCFIKQLGR